MSKTRHFLTLLDFSPAELQQLIRQQVLELCVRFPVYMPEG